eukprot:Gb_03500 [translate_table: standard]
MLVKASFMEPFQAQNFSSRPAISSAGQPPPVQGQPSKVFVGHTFYKGKAALNMKPKAPEFSTLDSGGMKLSKEGGMYLTFAPAVGTRQYDWSKKQVFALSVAELGSLLSLSSNESCEFFHDPFMGKSDAGQIRKVLQVVPVPNSPGYFFSLSISNKLMNVNERFSVSITKAEFAVMQSTFNFILPYVMGWHVFADSTKPDESTHFMSSKSDVQVNSDLEWDR